MSAEEEARVAAQIQAQLDRGISNLKRGDYRAAVGGLFAADAIFVRSGATMVGREAIEAMYAGRPGRLVDGWIRTISVAVHGDIAYEVGINYLVTENPEGSRATAKGRYLSVWRREPDGSWLIVADAPIADPPERV